MGALYAALQTVLLTLPPGEPSVDQDEKAPLVSPGVPYTEQRLSLLVPRQSGDGDEISE